LTVDIVTLFPAMFEGPLRESMLGRARQKGLIDVRVHSLRAWSDDRKHFQADDRPYGGGAGMVLQAEPIYRAVKDLGGLKKTRGKPWVVHLSPQGQTLTQKRVAELKKRRHIILICGHYEGVDERVLKWVDQEVSIGDYVLTGGELPAMVLIDCMARLVKGVVGDPESVANESFAQGLLDYPHFTRPAVWRKMKVPAVLLSGNHRDIAAWRKREAMERTRSRRPDLILKCKNFDERCVS
jgi:tRNA (guanine37-N1)-methyltransferase